METDFAEIARTVPGLGNLEKFKSRKTKQEYDRFVCKLCGLRRSYRLDDTDLFEELGWQCPDCYILIANRRYQLNIRNGVTVFSPMGRALGDRIIQEVVRRRYVADNPDERVIFLDKWQNDVFDRYKPDKVFWANLHSGGLRRPKGAKWFSLCNEVNAFARQGHFSKFDFKLSEQELENFEPFKGSVVFHLRNIDKAAETKNVKTYFAYAILRLLKNSGVDKIVLIGNDDNSNGLDLDTILFIMGINLPIFDFRKKLTLVQMGWLCHYAKLYIGKDSGPAHLAGAAGCQNMVVWGYQTRRYFPKVAEGVCTAFTREESDLDDVLEAVRERLKA